MENIDISSQQSMTGPLNSRNALILLGEKLDITKFYLDMTLIWSNKLTRIWAMPDNWGINVVIVECINKKFIIIWRQIEFSILTLPSCPHLRAPATPVQCFCFSPHLNLSLTTPLLDQLHEAKTYGNPTCLLFMQKARPCCRQTSVMYTNTDSLANSKTTWGSRLRAR